MILYFIVIFTILHHSWICKYETTQIWPNMTRQYPTMPKAIRLNSNQTNIIHPNPKTWPKSTWFNVIQPLDQRKDRWTRSGSGRCCNGLFITCPWMACPVMNSLACLHSYLYNVARFGTVVPCQALCPDSWQCISMSFAICKQKQSYFKYQDKLSMYGLRSFKVAGHTVWNVHQQNCYSCMVNSIAEFNLYFPHFLWTIIAPERDFSSKIEHAFKYHC